MKNWARHDVKWGKQTIRLEHSTDRINQSKTIGNKKMIFSIYLIKNSTSDTGIKYTENHAKLCFNTNFRSIRIANMLAKNDAINPVIRI